MPSSAFTMKLREAVTAYAEKPIASFDIFVDPHVDGCYAMRVRLCGKTDIVYFLVTHTNKKMTSFELMELLEEVELETWPPVADENNLKFF